MKPSAQGRPSKEEDSCPHPHPAPELEQESQQEQCHSSAQLSGVFNAAASSPVEKSLEMWTLTLTQVTIAENNAATANGNMGKIRCSQLNFSPVLAPVQYDPQANPSSSGTSGPHTQRAP